MARVPNPGILSHRLKTGAPRIARCPAMDIPMEYDEGPDEEWIEDEGEAEDDLLACPSCHAAVHEDTQQCPYCGDWIIPVDPHHNGWSRRLSSSSWFWP